MKNLIKAQFKLFITPQILITGLLFVLFTFANFFIKNRFFAGQPVDLSVFFSAIPYISILIIPSLCYKTSLYQYDDFIPASKKTKFTARTIVLLLIYIIFLIFLLPGIFTIGIFYQIDFGQFFVSFIFLIFYGLTAISLCLFINQLSANSIISFLTSAFILAVFNSSHNFTLYLANTNVFSNIFRQISFAWHFDSASKGIFDSRDILFFIILTLIFTEASVFISKIKADKTFTKIQSFRLYSIFILFILLLLNSSRYFFRLDFSKNKQFSVSKYSKLLFNQINEPLSITYYRSNSLYRLYPQLKNISDYLNSYCSNNKNVSFKIQNPDNNSKLTELLQNYGIQSQQLKNYRNNSTEYLSVYSAIVIEYKGRFSLVPFTMSAEALEYDLDIRLKSLISGTNQTVNIIIGNGKNFSSDYSYIVPYLTEKGFTCNPVFLESPDFYKILEVSKGPLLVIGDNNISIDKAIAIENYILKNNGNGLFTVSPYSVDIEDSWKLTENSKTNIVEMLENWGIFFEDKIAADISCSRITMVSQNEDSMQGSGNYNQVLNYPLWVKLPVQNNSINNISLFWPCSIKITDNNMAKPYLYSTEKGYSYQIDKNRKNNTEKSDSLVETNPFVLNTQNFGNTKFQTQILGAQISGNLPGLYNLEQSKSSKIIVIPDQYFLSTLMTGYNSESELLNYNNFEFLTTALLELSNQNELAKLHNKTITNSLKIKESENYIALVYSSIFILFILVPAIMIICSVIFFKKQKKWKSK